MLASELGQLFCGVSGGHFNTSVLGQLFCGGHFVSICTGSFILWWTFCLHLYGVIYFVVDILLTSVLCHLFCGGHLFSLEGIC